MSKPVQLVVTDFSGHHANHLETKVEELRRGGSWKQQRTVIIIPSADMISVKVMMAFWNLAFPPNNGVVKIAAIGDEVGIAYSNAIEAVLNHPQLKDWEYVLCMEHDNLPPSDGMIKLVERMEQNPDLAAIGGLYFTKGPGGVAQIWGDINDPIPNFRPQLPDVNGGLKECCGTGMGFTLFRIAMFKDERIKRPWFRTLKGKDGEGVGTQDLTFWTEARKYGYRCAVDCAVKVGHYDRDGSIGGIPDFVW